MLVRSQSRTANMQLMQVQGFSPHHYYSDEIMKICFEILGTLEVENEILVDFSVAAILTCIISYWFSFC